MNENNNIPTLLPENELQDIYRQHRYGRGYYRYFDREGRLAWSNKDGYNHYTWYLYNDLGEIIEMGESFVNAGALGHVVTVAQCTTAEAGEYIRSKAGRDNVLRLAPTATVDSTLIQTRQTSDLSTAIIPAEPALPLAPSAESPALTMQAAIILSETDLRPIPPAESKLTTIQSGYTSRYISATANDTSFADHLLNAIFTTPDQNRQVKSSILQPYTININPQPSFHNIPAYYLQPLGPLYHITIGSALPLQTAYNAQPGTLYLHSPPLQNTS